MSAWFMLSALGFLPCTFGELNLCSLIAAGKRATVQVNRGHQLEIVAKRRDPKYVYVQSFTLNGKRQ